MTKRHWPKILFGVTLLAFLAIGILSFFYYQSIAQLQIRNQTIAEARNDYEKRIADLKGKLVIEQTQTVTIPTPTVTQECKSLNLGNLGNIISGGGSVCIPRTQIVQREVQQVVKTEDPKVRAELDAALAQLTKLSNESVTASSNLPQLTAYYDLSQKMMKPIISIILLIASLYIILSKSYNADQEKWAFGSLGTILGFWLK